MLRLEAYFLLSSWKRTRFSQKEILHGQNEFGLGRLKAIVESLIPALKSHRLCMTLRLPCSPYAGEQKKAGYKATRLAWLYVIPHKGGSRPVPGLEGVGKRESDGIITVNRGWEGHAFRDGLYRSSNALGLRCSAVWLKTWVLQSKNNFRETLFFIYFIFITLQETQGGEHT